MMQFFRKYQRFFLVFTTAIIVISFFSFGTFSTYMDEPEFKDEVMVKAVDGSDIYLSEVRLLARFLVTDREEQGFGAIPNFCNDGVLRYDLLQTGLADLIAKEYFESMQEGIQKRWERAKRHRPYAHPDAPFLSVVSVWDRLVPGLSQEVAALQKEATLSWEVFQRFSRIYQLASRFSPEWVRRMLLFQCQQYSWVKPDPRLLQEDLSVFGFHSASDWFGSEFLEMSAQFILNAARVAEKKGYRVSLEEAKADLINQFNRTVQQVVEKGGNPDRNFHSHIRRIGFEEKTLIEVWRNVLLFRRYFQGAGQAAFVDRMPYADFAAYALEAVAVQYYEWPQEMKVHTPTEQLRLQTYIQAVSGITDHELPQELFPLEKIQATHPELVQTTYRAKIAKVSKEEVGLRASMKEVWDWELDEHNWKRLQEKYPSLAVMPLVTREERFKALETLSSNQKKELDLLARSKLVDAHPEWIEEALNTEGVAQEIQVSNTHSSLPHIVKPGAFRVSLDAARQAHLSCSYSDDGTHHYLLSEIEQIAEPHLISFATARAQNLLTPKDSMKPDPYLARRWEIWAEKALADLKINPSDPKWVANGSDPLIDQFKLVKLERLIQRTAQEDWMREEAFHSPTHEWSSVHVAPEGNVAFFYTEERRPHTEPILEQLFFGKEAIAADAQRFLAERLLEEIRKKQSMQGGL